MKKMMVLAAALVSSVVFSQRIQSGESQLNAGLGFSSGWGIPIYAGYDYGLTDHITVGVQGSYTSNNDKVTHQNVEYNQKATWLGIGANANYHFNDLFNIPEKFDLYAGATLAFNNFTYKDSYQTSKSSFGLAGQLGGRYFFTNKLGINLEFGGGNVASGGKVGITYKLN